MKTSLLFVSLLAGVVLAGESANPSLARLFNMVSTSSSLSLPSQMTQAKTNSPAVFFVAGFVLTDESTIKEIFGQLLNLTSPPPSPPQPPPTTEDKKTPPAEKNTSISDPNCPGRYFEYVDSQCKCRPNYIQHHGRCFGLKSAECQSDSDCAFNILVCEAGKCLHASRIQVGTMDCSSKSKNMTCWKPKTPDRKVEIIEGSPDNHCRVWSENREFRMTGGLTQTSTGQVKCGYIWNSQYLLADNFQTLYSNYNIKWWISPYPLNQAIYGGPTEDGQSIIVPCTAGGSKYIGRTSSPKFDQCTYADNGEIRNTSTFYVLVYGASYYAS